MAAMQIVSGTSNLIPARSASVERPTAGKAGERVTALLSQTNARTRHERVLQGELLQRGREPERTSSRRAEVYDSRREDHPAFYQRHTNQEFVQRRALAAYRVYSNPDSGAVSGRGVDYFI